MLRKSKGTGGAGAGPQEGGGRVSGWARRSEQDRPLLRVQWAALEGLGLRVDVTGRLGGEQPGSWGEDGRWGTTEGGYRSHPGTGWWPLPGQVWWWW